MLIAQISDTHLFDPTADHPSVDARAEWLRQCVASINAEQPDAVLFTGDTVQTAKHEEYELLLQLLQPLQAPLYIVPGNRDDNVLLKTVFSDYVDLPPASDVFNYVVDRHEVRLVALDSTESGERKGFYSAERREWLDGVLTEDPSKPTILFIHHPPFDVGDHYIGGYRHPEDATGLADVVGRHSQVQALICGHVHHPVQQEWAGIRGIVMPSVAVDLRKGVDEEAVGGQPVYWLHRASAAEAFSSELKVAGTA